jgi:acyl carrier protein
MKTVLRRILSEWARLDVPPDTLADDADLYAAGLSAIGTVQLMLSIEDEFDIEIPNRMLRRDVFSSIDSLAAAVTELQGARAGGGMNAPLIQAAASAGAFSPDAL